MPETQPFSVRDLLPQAPDEITVITGDQHLIAAKSEIFYTEVLDYLGITYSARRAGFAEIQSFAAMQSNHEGELLTIAGGMPIASTLYVSNDTNYIVGAFAHYLTPAVENEIRGRLSRQMPNRDEIRESLMRYQERTK
jgi:hypothetical protein